MSDAHELPDEDQSQVLQTTGAAICPSCGAFCEFELPDITGSFDIACYECAHIYEITAESATQMAVMRADDHAADDHAIVNEDDLHSGDMPTDNTSTDDTLSSVELIKCLECGGAIEVTQKELDDPSFVPNCPHCSDEIDFNAPTRFDLPPALPSSSRQRTGIILASILSFGLILTASFVALGLYFLSQRADSSVTRFIETNILQLAPAKFEVQSASYEVSETDLGTSLLVTITISNTGETQGTPEEMKVVLTDAQNAPLVTWPLDTAGQIINPGQTTQLYTRLFEPPADFAQLRVLVR
ncbi:MAG: hypothetical protein ACON49_05365 [Candidatus Puniceispirillaceae bacterium]